MDIELIILDSFPSLEKLIVHDDLLIEINNIQYNLRKLTLLKESILLKNIPEKIIFKLLLAKDKIFLEQIY